MFGSSIVGRVEAQIVLRRNRHWALIVSSYAHQRYVVVKYSRLNRNALLFIFSLLLAKFLRITCRLKCTFYT
jgi:hypothetical protein